MAVATTELTKAPGVKGASGRGVSDHPSQWRQRLFWLLLRRTTATSFMERKWSSIEPNAQFLARRPIALLWKQDADAFAHEQSRRSADSLSGLNAMVKRACEPARADKKPVRCERHLSDVF